MKSNNQYLEMMTLCHVWHENEWDNEIFNSFCKKMYKELGGLVLACGLTLDNTDFFKTLVQDAYNNKSEKMSKLGYLFGGVDDLDWDEN